MTIRLLAVGKTDHSALSSLIAQYTNRLKHYVRFEWIFLPNIKRTKNLSEEQQKVKEGTLILKHIGPADHLILLDEHGKQFTSIDFAEFIQQKMNSSLKNLVFVIGGPYGFDKSIEQRSNMCISLSKMTFSHQMVRLFFVEQIYRAFTILKHEPYHHR